LLGRLRRIADQDDAPNTAQPDAREYLLYLETASFGSISVTADARVTVTVTGDLQSVRQVVEVPRPRCGTT
jgi:hypothetical protein